MNQCFGYIRVSTVRQGDGVSLEAQREAINAFASHNNLIIIQWFEEKETAAKRGRPVFDDMMRQLKRGKADGLIVHKIDRSARNFADWAKIGELADTGIDIHFASESLDFRSRGGRLAADIQAVVAADYIRNLKEETRKGINGRLKQGLYPFRAPIGYVDNGGGQPKTLDPVRAPLVKQAFKFYASRRYSLRSLLTELQRQGLTNRSGGRLSLCGLETMLANPFYTGIIHIKRTGQTYQGSHERLISPRTFQTVQDVRAGRCGPKITRHDHTYRGLFRCGLCEGPMVPELQKQRYVYYRCQRRGCATTTVREEAIQKAIDDCLLNAQLTEEDGHAFEAGLEAWLAPEQAKETAASIALRRANLADRVDRLTDALVDRLIDKDAFSERRQRLALEEANLEEELSEIEKKGEKADQARTVIELAKTLQQSHRLADRADKREIVELTTSNRRVVGKNVYLEPCDWILKVKNTGSDLSGAPAPDGDRTFSSVLSRVSAIAKLIELPKLTLKPASKPRFKKAA